MAFQRANITGGDPAEFLLYRNSHSRQVLVYHLCMDVDVAYINKNGRIFSQNCVCDLKIYLRAFVRVQLIVMCDLF